MSAVVRLIGSLNPQPVYDASAAAARYVAATFTPVLLIIAIYLRTLQTQLDALGGAGRWAQALRDIALWGTVLAVYFGVATVLAGFMNAVYHSVDRIGSLDLITGQLARLIAAASAKRSGAGSIAGLVDDLAANLVKAVMFVFYYLTLLVVAFLAAFLRVAQAIAYGVAFLWGLIAIPLSIANGLRLLRPWGQLLGTVLLWPVVQALMLALFAPVFQHAANALVADPAVTAADSGGMVYMLYSILNLIVSALLVAAPFVAHTLVASGAVGGLVGPFTAAAVAAGSGLARRLELTSGAAAFARGHSGPGADVPAGGAAVVPRPRPPGTAPPSAQAADSPIPAPAGDAAGPRRRRPAPRRPRQSHDRPAAPRS
ncbi:MAG: hypothetical protein ACYDHY_16820 [Acidiferrobacterales bacterium]